MTEAEAKWLKLLRDEGPQSIDVLFDQHHNAEACFANGWTSWTGDPDQPEEITPAGLAALEAFENATR